MELQPTSCLLFPANFPCSKYMIEASRLKGPTLFFSSQIHNNFAGWYIWWGIQRAISRSFSMPEVICTSTLLWINVTSQCSKLGENSTHWREGAWALGPCLASEYSTTWLIFKSAMLTCAGIGRPAVSSTVWEQPGASTGSGDIHKARWASIGQGVGTKCPDGCCLAGSSLSM